MDNEIKTEKFPLPLLLPVGLALAFMAYLTSDIRLTSSAPTPGKEYMARGIAWHKNAWECREKRDTDRCNGHLMADGTKVRVVAIDQKFLPVGSTDLKSKASLINVLEGEHRGQAMFTFDRNLTPMP
jgi:hypothetical protein